MDVICFYKEVVFPVSRDRMLKGLMIDGHNLMPKLLPHIIKSVKFIEGDGGPGSIKETAFTEESGYAEGGTQLHRIDICDTDNFMYRQTLIKGGLMFEKMHSVVYEVKFEALGNEKCIAKLSSEYHPKEDILVTREDIEKGKAINFGFYKAMIDYLRENPDAYA